MGNEHSHRAIVWPSRTFPDPAPSLLFWSSAGRTNPHKSLARLTQPASVQTGTRARMSFVSRLIRGDSFKISHHVGQAELRIENTDPVRIANVDKGPSRSADLAASEECSAALLARYGSAIFR